MKIEGLQVGIDTAAYWELMLRAEANYLSLTITESNLQCPDREITKLRFRARMFWNSMSNRYNESLAILQN